MSTIQKMSIQGIRSFGPDDRERQIIQFFNPLTLILGSNGTGKTTIIECLKYMTTGDMPPGSKGGAFIHDPKVAHEREVKGQIRLQFSDVTLKQCIVQRSVVVTQKAKKMEMRTLDGVITRCGPDGEKQSISSRCAEIDKEMVTSLGVSKAVLENVIFCHQEDANWPLSEGKTLKDKFDAIFASTRYVKALDTIRKVKTEQDGSLREYRTEIKYLKQNKEHASKLQDKLGEFEAKFAACQESMDKLKTELRPVEERLDELNAKASEISKITAKLEKVLGEKDMLEKSINELQSNIENEFQGSTRELERCLHEFQDKVGDVESTVTQFEDKRRSLQRQIEKLQTERQKIDVDVGKLQQEATVHEDTIQQRDTLIRTLAAEYGFEGLDHGVINDEKYTQFALSMKSTVDKFIDQAAQVKNEHDSRETELQTQVDSVKEQRTKLEQNCHLKKQTMDKNQREIRQISQKLSDVDASAGRLDQLIHELRQAERDLQNVQSSVNLDELKTDIDKLQIEKRDMESKVNTLSTEMNKLHQQSSTQTEINMLNKQKVEKEDGIRRIKSRHEETLKYLLEGALTQNVRSDLDDYLFKQTDGVKQAEKQLQETKMDLSRKEVNKKNLMDMLKKKEQELKGYEEKISSVCGSQNYDDGLAALQQKMTTAQDTRGTLIGAEHFFKKYVSDFKKDDPCCPLCHRAFDAEQEVRELIIELENKLRLVPTRLQKSEHELEQLQNQYDEMLQLKPIQDSMSTLEEELPELQRKVAQLTTDIDKLKSSIQEKEQDLQAKQNDEGMANGLRPDIIMMDRYMGEVRDLDRKITAMSVKMAAAGSGRTLEQVTEEKDDAQMLLETVNCQLEHKREKRSNHSEKLHQMKSHVNDLMANKMTIERDLADRNKLEERKDCMSTEIETLRKDIQEAEEELAPLQGQINRLMQEKERVRKIKEEDVDKIRAQVDAVRSKGTDVRQLNAKIKKYISDGKANTLQRQQEKQEKTRIDISELTSDDVELSSNLDSLRKELADQKVHERELLDNLQLQKKRSEITGLEKTISTIQEEIGGYDMASLEISKRQIENTRDGMRREYHEANLRQKTHEEGVRQAKEELNSAQYKNATIDYRDKMIILRTTEIANMDLEKYYKALDRAIMNYHNMKMHEINKIIRELWRNTYRGNDIETIEIRSDEDESGIMKQRRNYHYRVVMVKGNNTELDMRGRCSAGQKVLASLIIRLALAETFCLNCGILALDEPTTNLDRENIESLAFALAEIIKSREGQRNFQLIVITHDEDFVELLGRSDFVDDFFKIKKTPNGFSQITKSRVSELHMR